MAKIKMTKAQQQKLIKRAIVIKAQLEQIKPLYRELDEIVAVLAAAGFSSGIIDKRLVILVDNFEDKNTCFRVARVNRYELREEAAVKNRNDPFKVRRRGNGVA